MGDSEASPIAPYPSDGRPSVTQLASSETLAPGAPPEYPRRPGEPDCSYYVKFGSCGYGTSCWFNHPPKPAGSSRCGEIKPEYPRRPGEPDCSYYVKFGSCGYGMSCMFNHPPETYRLAANAAGGSSSRSGCEASSSEQYKQYSSRKACKYNPHGGQTEVEQVKLNLLGLPLRPGIGLCSYYMHRGICKFGINCKFHHPDRESEHASWNASWQVIQGSSQLNFSSELVRRALNGQYVPLATSPTNGTLEIIPTQGDYPCAKWSGYQHRDSCFETAKRVQYTRDQLLELREVQTQSCNRYDRTDSCVWRSRSSQIPVVASEEKSWDNIYEAQESYAPSGKQEQLNKHDQLNFQLDSNAQVYIPWSIQRGNLSDRDGVLMAVKGTLDKLTPEKFDLVKDRLIEAGINRDDILEDVITVMFEKAVSEPTFCPTYAQLCSYLNKKLPSSPPEEPDGKEIAFASVLLSNCHEVFKGAGNLCAEIDRMTGPDQEMETQNKQIMLMKLRTLGNIHLIGELLKQKIVIERIVQHTVQMDENMQGKPDWDTFATKVFCDICTDEVLAGNRPTEHLNAIGYDNLYTKFNEKTKKGYNHEQFKSKWESLKKDYQTWKALMDSEDDLGQDPKMNTISASPEWWAKKMEAMPDCGKFRSAPLENVDLLNIMFEDMLDSSSTTPEVNLAVNTTIESEHGASDGNDMRIIDKDVNEQSKEAMLQKSCNKESNSTKPNTICVHDHLVNLDENVNPGKSATSMRIDRVGSNISEIMELVVDAGVEEGTDEHFIATELFIRPEYREMFLTLKPLEEELGGLKRCAK
ncbi:zinc finger CCCH domain-containing protein 43 isoform X1 [Lolium perenne]|uniref:zinc finger CCCH domain-containing protein 43 isoform X1 n=1 Tax=Lolium perenne TaxID=4522 RepID=UPI0021F6954A|nr:zinc finger CCCH domain-containing protein 43-like [Lolium perenne]